MMMNKDGMILLNKPEGITSFRSLGILKKKLESKKVGHTGTLDKFASGLLVVLSGKMTKFAPYITGMDKTYHVTFRFGSTTETLDPEGEVVGDEPIPDLETIKNSINNHFNGDILQTPPDFSAVHVNGKRAYQLKLEGKEVKIPPRKINITQFDIVDWNGNDLKAIISCSKGTYIRSIARDLGKKCNSLAYVTELKRTKVGPFDLKNAILGEDFTVDNIRTPYELAKFLNKPIAFIKDEHIDDIQSGKYIKCSYYTDPSVLKENGEVMLFNSDKKLIAMVEIKNGKSKYCFVVPK